jgi:hypothetical protein
MQWSLLLLFLVEKVRKKIYQSKSIPDVHKFVLRLKIFSAGSLTKSYAKERSILASKDFSQVLYSGSEMADTVKNIYQLLKYISAAQVAHFSLINFSFYIDKKTACNFLSLVT